VKAGARILRLPVTAMLAAAFTLVPPACSKKKENRPDQPPLLPRKNYDTARLFNGVSLRTRVSCGQGTVSTLETIAETNSYEADITLHIRWPVAATNTAAVLAATPELGGLFRDLGTLLSSARVSPAFAILLDHKEKRLRSSLSQLQKLPTRDSLFDCQTILELRKAGRSALLVQAIMNVNTDGSDGDRNLTVDHESPTWQPQTNYRWAKTGHRPNPALKSTEERVALLEAELGNGTLTPDNRSSLGRDLEEARATAAELKRWDFLVGPADPFIVLPSFMVGKTPGQPGIGDYAVVVCRGKLYPAILGDMGPGSKIGEASLRLCRAIDADAGADKRPVNRPVATYIVFPGTADKPFQAPDYDRWSARCRDLWKQLGGSENAVWQEWTSLEKPWPTPTPALSPIPTPGNSISAARESSSPVIGTDSAASAPPPASNSPTSGLPSPAATR
jgi:Fungal chitosanase of glycosyl hydrolase group 75